jgi:polynucleotide 5'-kinase involved in rRNA processing
LLRDGDGSRGPAATYIAEMTDTTHDAIAREVSRSGLAMLMGSVDTGKTTLALQSARLAIGAGRTVALVDADVGNSTVGPPACVGLKVLRTLEDIDNVHTPDRLHFVGTITPARLVLQQVVATVAMVDKARALADLVILDTTAVVSGVAGETLKYHKAELCRPDKVVALQRGGEMEPVVGMLRRFLGLEVTVAPTDPNLIPLSPDERAQRRTDAFARALAPPLERWKVRPTVFAPTLPMGLNLGRLDEVLVGVQDEGGGCLGLGILSNEDDGLRVMTNTGEGMKGLRLGSMRLDPITLESSVISLREVMFGV